MTRLTTILLGLKLKQLNLSIPIFTLALVLSAGLGEPQWKTDFNENRSRDLVADGVNALWGGSPTDAVRLFDESFQFDPTNSIVYEWRGNAYSDLGQYQRALQDFNEAIELGSRSGFAYFGRSYVYKDLG